MRALLRADRERQGNRTLTVHQTPQATGEQRLTVDGIDQAGAAIPLIDDRMAHKVEVWVRAVA